MISRSMYILFIPATENRNEQREWFHTIDELCRYLCGSLYAYADSNDGKVIDHTGETIGEWFHATRSDA